jgi:glycosyltransferase involved in cell wall biosynthesis
MTTGIAHAQEPSPAAPVPIAPGSTHSQWPSISIVTPSYNQGQFLEETICSVLDQKYPNLQYMVIDGGSTDNSVEIIRKYAKYLDYWVSEKDKGQMDALNKGVRRSTGDIFGFINSDDYLYPKALQRVAETWQQGARWIVGWTMYLESGGTDYPYLHGPYLRKIDYFLDNPFPQQSSFWDRKFFDEVGAFDEELHYCFDYEWWMRLKFKANAKPTIIRHCLGAFRLHPESKTCHDWSKSEAAFEVIRAQYQHYLTPYEKLKWWSGRREMEATAAKKKMWRALSEHDIPLAKQQAITTLKAQPLSVDSWKSLFFAFRGH